MTGARDYLSHAVLLNFAGIKADAIEESFYYVYSYSRIESVEHALTVSV